MSILGDIKKVRGIPDDYTAFDLDIITAINSAFFTLWQLGVGKDASKPFSISGSETSWEEFVDPGLMEVCKSFIALRVRLEFDPPSSSYLVENINKQLSEMEFRMLCGVDEYDK